MKIKFLQDWRYSRQGDVIDEGNGVAELLIQRGIAEEVLDEEVLGEGKTEVSQTRRDRPEIQTRRIPGPREK